MRDPESIGDVVSKFITLRGLARVQGDAQLAGHWKKAAGDAIAKQTRVVGIKRRVLHIDVNNAPLLSELVSFHRQRLLKTLQTDHPELKLKDLKFRLHSR